MRVEFITPFIFVFFILTGCNYQEDYIQGYTEDDYIYISSEYPTVINSFHVRKGDKVNVGDLLFKIDEYSFIKKLEGLKKNKKYEESILDNMLKGIRQSEIDIINIDIRRINIELKKAKLTLNKKLKLKENGYVTEEEIESEKLAVVKKRSELQKIQAELKNKTLPAREDEVTAQRFKIKKIETDIEQIHDEILRTTVKSPVQGIVQDIVRREGEVINPGTPVVVIAPDNSMRIKFYVNRSALHHINYGDLLLITLHDLRKNYDAEISYISSKPEYIPPMIYDSKNDTWVYLVEATLSDKTVRFPAGQPVEVRFR